MPQFVVILRYPQRPQGAEGLMQHEDLHLPTNHPCLPQGDVAVVS